MKSIHVFKVGDRVIYSVTVKSIDKEGRKHNTHLRGRGIVLYRFAGTFYMIRTPKGLEKLIDARNLKKENP